MQEFNTSRALYLLTCCNANAKSPCCLHRPELHFQTVDGQLSPDCQLEGSCDLPFLYFAYCSLYLLRCCKQGHATCPDKSCILKLLVVNWALIASWKAASISLFCQLLTILLIIFPLHLLTVYCNATAAISSPCNWLPRQELHSQSGGCLQLSLDCQLVAGCCSLPQIPNLYFAPIFLYFDGRAQFWWSCQWFQCSILIPILPDRGVRWWL